MKIAATQFSLNTKSFEIYVSGCDGACDKVNQKFIDDGIYEARCHNPELWDFNLGTDSTDEKLRSRISTTIEQFDDLIEWVCVMGGEPCLQNEEELVEFLEFLSNLGKRIILFTRQPLDKIPRELMGYCYAIKTGMYLYEKKGITESLGFKLSSSNQKIIRVSEINGNN